MCKEHRSEIREELKGIDTRLTKVEVKVDTLVEDIKEIKSILLNTDK